MFLDRNINWVTREGKKIAIKKLTTIHLINILKFMKVKGIRGNNKIRQTLIQELVLRIAALVLGIGIIIYFL